VRAKKITSIIQEQVMVEDQDAQAGCKITSRMFQSLDEKVRSKSSL
jgi:hypothetical protein